MDKRLQRLGVSADWESTRFRNNLAPTQTSSPQSINLNSDSFE